MVQGFQRILSVTDIQLVLIQSAGSQFLIFQGVLTCFLPGLKKNSTKIAGQYISGYRGRRSFYVIIFP